MSTILKTLKKLEEDKRLLEKDLDLKELVLQEDHEPSVRKTLEIPRNNIIVVSLSLAGIIVVALIWGSQPAVKNEATPIAQIPPAQKPVSTYKEEPRPTVGVPLSNIPERRQRFEEAAGEKFPPATVEDISPVREDREVRKVREIFEPVQEPAEINEIRDLIQTATLEAEQPQSYPDELVSHGVSIPNLRVKGIIFFSSGSPSNHIFVSTSASKNRKVRVGETIQSATLKHIEPNRVVFSYRGETVHLRIGE